MARFAVGDLQGCLDPLLCLLDRVNFKARRDQLWVVGDLINRGPQSLQTLRYLKELSDRDPESVRVVLGNHDLHFLAVAWDKATLKPGDTLAPLLNAPDRPELIDWLRRQPLVYSDRSGDYSMVHAGIPPNWSLKKAHKHAREVEAVLQSDDIDKFFAHMYGNEPDLWDKDLSGWPRLRLITNYLTRMRFCSAEGQLDLQNKTGSSSSNEFAPWFSFEQRKSRKHTILFGHWAALEGKVDDESVVALDTGCVWGGALTMMCLEDGQLYRCEC